MWDVIDYSNDYFENMLEMTEEYYGKENDIANEDFIQHEYFMNPAGNAYIKLAYDAENSTVAGQYIVIPRDYFVDGCAYKSVLSLNTLTREAYRGQKVFTILAEELYGQCAGDGVNFCYGAPNPNSFPGFMKKLSFRHIGDVPLMLKIQNPFRIIMDKLGVSYHYCELVSERRTINHIDIVKIDRRNISLLDEFWNQIKSKYEVIGVRNSEYLQWRYLDMPRRDYIIYAAVRDGNILGYVVGRMAEVAGMRCGMFVDFIIDKGEKAAGKALVKMLKAYFKSAKVGLLGCLMMKDTEEYRILKSFCFFVCPKMLLPQPFHIILRIFKQFPQDKKEELADFKNWFFTMGDYDVI